MTIWEFLNNNLVVLVRNAMRNNSRQFNNIFVKLINDIRDLAIYYSERIQEIIKEIEILEKNIEEDYIGFK